MPLRFCKTRWIENVSVVERIVEMIFQLHQYVKEVQENKVSHPQTKTFGVVKEENCDPLVEAKLVFYRYGCKKIKRFLILYQCDAPMMPHLTNDWFDLRKSLMSSVIKADVMNTTISVKLCGIDVTNTANLLTTKKW